MSIRRFVQIVAFVSALAFAFAAPMVTDTGYACDPQTNGGWC